MEERPTPPQPDECPASAASPGSPGWRTRSLSPGRSPAAIKAMEATFDLCEAIGTELTIGDLTAVCMSAIEEGHDTMHVRLAMMSVAIQTAKELSGQRPKNTV